MRRTIWAGIGALALGLTASGAAFAQAAPAPDPATLPFEAGKPLAASDNVKIIGGMRFAESCSYDAERDVYVLPNAGIAQNLQENDGSVTLMNPDGTAHTIKFIGTNRNGLTLNHPLGSDIANGMLYVADIDTIRWFDLATGEPKGAAPIEGAAVINDIEVADDGTVYATQHGNADGTTPWRLYKLGADGATTILAEGAPLARPNGVAFDPDGNIVLVNIGSDDILTFSPTGELLKTEKSLQAGNDGLVIIEDGTKYVSSVMNGTVAVIRPGAAAEKIAEGIPTPASMCLDTKRNRLVIPMNNNDAVAFVELN